MNELYGYGDCADLMADLTRMKGQPQLYLYTFSGVMISSALQHGVLRRSPRLQRYGVFIQCNTQP